MAIDLSSLSSVLCPFISVFQQVIDSLFGAFSFLGVSAPSLSSLLGVTCG
ncbi:MAG: hypothetical protein ACE5F9_15315 [Phycisphaerae bacterium]